MPRLLAHVRSLAESAVCSLAAAASAVYVLLLGSGGAAELLGPEGAAEAGIAL